MVFIVEKKIFGFIHSFKAESYLCEKIRFEKLSIFALLCCSSCNAYAPGVR